LKQQLLLIDLPVDSARCSGYAFNCTMQNPKPPALYQHMPLKI